MCLINYFTWINNEYISIMFHLESQLFYLLIFQLLLCESELDSNPMDTCPPFCSCHPSQSRPVCFADTFSLHSLLWWTDLFVLRWVLHLSISIICSSTSRLWLLTIKLLKHRALIIVLKTLYENTEFSKLTLQATLKVAGWTCQ